MKNVIDIIVAEAKREDEELKRKRIYRNLEKKTSQEQEEVIENMLLCPSACNVIVDIRELPVSVNTFTSFDPHIFLTNGTYTLRYIPKTDVRYVPGKPFVIGQDLVRLRVTVSGPEHWHRLAERIPELGWIDRNSYITRRLFGIAKRHPGIPFTFTVKWEEYNDKIAWKAREAKINIDNKPFVSYKCSKKLFEEELSDKFLCEKKTDLDYAKEIADTDKEFLSVLTKKGDK